MSTTPPGRPPVQGAPGGARGTPARRRAGLAGAPPGGGVAGGFARWWTTFTWRRVLALGAAGIALVVGILGATVAYAALTLPNFDEIGQRTGTIKVVDRNGKLIAELGHDQRSVHTVAPAEISPYMKCAMISAEDRNFYAEGAFDVPRVLKALFVDVIARRPQQGASTITQQLAKQTFFGQAAEKSALRKLREALLANQINSKYSKDDILAKYLNLIYFGENSYGIDNAAETFFGVHAKDLNLQQSAMLAGLPQAPSALDPRQNPDGAYARMHYVVQGMVLTCAKNQDQLHVSVSQQEADAVDPLAGDATQRLANQQALSAALTKGSPKSAGSLAPHFAQYIEDQLPQLLGDDPSFLNGSLTVTTTLDLGDQNQAQAVVQAGVDKLRPRNANNGALLLLDAHTGQIYAMVGSADFNNNSIAGQYNVVTGERRPGSSFKPYVFETAFRNNVIKPDTLMDDTAAESAKLGNVQNFDNRFQGRITAARALLLSRNVVAEQTGVRVGMDNVIQFAQSLGISTRLENNPSTAIGSSSVRMIEHTAAYAAFANGGHKVQAYGILKVADDQGNIIKDLSTPDDRGTVMSEGEAASITNILKNYARQWHHGFKVHTAGKSGTTDNFVDAWYMVYTPDFVLATWTGHTEAANPGEIGMNTVFGNDVAEAIAVPYLNALGLQDKPFPNVKGSLHDCYPPDAQLIPREDCSAPTPSPSPSASPTDTPAPSPSDTPVPSSTPDQTPPPVTFAPTPTSAATPCPSAAPTSSPRPSRRPTPAPTPTPICP